MKSAVILGGTTTGKRVYQEVKDKYRILYFADGNPELIGKEIIDGINCIEISAIFQVNPDVIFLGTLTGYEDIKLQLIKNGYPEDDIIEKYIDLPTRARVEFLEKASLILDTNKVKGAVAELGVYKGDFAKEINRTFPQRKLYLFDTFEGFPREDIAYEADNGLLLNYVGKLSDTSVEYVLGRMPHREQCVVCKGYFPETASGIEEQFAFVNIDADLYKPILAGLEYFWERLAEGGIILVHDYFSFSYEGAKKAIDEFSLKYNIPFMPIGGYLEHCVYKKELDRC